MAFKEVLDLDCDTTVALGGMNKKTGKPNPTRVEGYYIGKKETENRKSKTGKSNLYIFQTAKGNIGVWGKTDLDRKMASALIGAMTRVTQSGSVPTPNGDMYKFKVEVDAENTIEVSAPAQDESSEDDADTSSYASSAEDDDGVEETDVDAEEAEVEAAPAPRAQPPRQPARTPDAARQEKVKNLLAGRR
jgi:hypothetical protein